MKYLSFLLLIMCAEPLFAADAKESFFCTSKDLMRSAEAKLTFLRDGSGQVVWTELAKSKTSIGEPNSSEEIGDIYDLTDSTTGEEGYQLIISHALADVRISGTVEMWGEGSSHGVYDCK